MALSSAAEQYRKQQRLTALAVRDARKVRDDNMAVAQVVNRYQLAAAQVGADSVPEMLAEQGIPDLPVAKVNPQAFMSGGRAAEMVASAASDMAVDRLVATLVQDSGRSAAGVATAVRPNVDGHVRYLNPPSCSRCAILAGRIYRWSQGFQRHPLCDCVMVPTTMSVGPELISDPLVAFERGQVRGLSTADQQAIRDGADMGQVVNIRRKAAGLSSSGTALTRGGRLTPDGIYALAKSRDDAVELLQTQGYVIVRKAAPLRQVAGSPAEVTAAKPIVGDFQESLAGANPRHNKAVKVTGNFSADKATGAEIGYNYNCPNAVTAFEMRMRGQAVSAKPITNPATEGRVDKFLERWRTPEGNVPDMIQTRGLRGTQDLVKSWGEGGRGFVMVQWKRDGGHVLMARNDGGKVRFFDPQSGEERGDDMFQRVATRMAWATRSDNLTPAVDFGDFVE